MTLIYYRDKYGKILRYHLLPKGMTPEQLEIEIKKFNERGDAKAYSQEIEADSLEMYLFEKAQYRKRFPKEVISAALEAIEEARNAIECIETTED